MNPAETYILKHPEPFRSIMLHLQGLVQSTVPEAVLLFKWRIPYFYLKGKKPLVYLHVSRNYVDLGFAKGFQLQQHQEVLIGEKRNTIKSLRYYTLEDIDEDVVKELLVEAKNLST